MIHANTHPAKLRIWTFPVRLCPEPWSQINEIELEIDVMSELGLLNSKPTCSILIQFKYQITHNVNTFSNNKLGGQCLPLRQKKKKDYEDWVQGKIGRF